MENKEIEKEFGEFGEIAVKNCFFCGKTVRKSNCNEYSKFPANMNSSSMSDKYSTKHNVCLKCLLKGLYGICKDKEKMNEYFDLYIKVVVAEELEKANPFKDAQTITYTYKINQKV
jgi:hypothetical protein